MNRGPVLYDGKAKIIYAGESPNTLIQYFKDDTTANNAKKHSIITGKGVLNNRISEFLMKKIGDIGIPTHFIKRLNMREQLIKKVGIIPIEFVIRNVAAGSICRRFDIKEGVKLPRPIVEFYFKNDKLGDPLMSECHVLTFNYLSSDELDEIIEYCLRINDFLKGIFIGIGINLIDFKLEYGRLGNEFENKIVLADEISPDNCRLWDILSNKKLDKDRFREDLGGLKEAYHEVAYRLGILQEETNDGNLNKRNIKSIPIEN